MSKIAIEGNASGTGTFTIASPNSNSSRTLSLPDGTGTFVVNGINSAITAATAQASTSGTSIDFTGIPSWVKRITVMFSGVSTNSTSIPQIQLGDAGGVETTDYLAMVTNIQTSPNTTRGVTATSGFIYLHAGNATSVVNGSITFSLLGSNTWTVSGNLYDSGGAQLNTVSGAKVLSDTLDRVRITTVNGTDTFDAGTINILYE